MTSFKKLGPGLPAFRTINPVPHLFRVVQQT